jgi:hypothetical protein
LVKVCHGFLAAGVFFSPAPELPASVNYLSPLGEPQTYRTYILPFRFTKQPFPED